VSTSIRKTTWNFNRSPVARHSDANAAAAAAAAAAYSLSAATQVPITNGNGGAAAVVTPAMEARFKLEQVMFTVLQKEITPTILMRQCLLNAPFVMSHDDGVFCGWQSRCQQRSTWSERRDCDTCIQFLSSRAANWAAAEFLKVTLIHESSRLLASLAFVS
jgi:hypothetical protein